MSNESAGQSHSLSDEYDDDDDDDDDYDDDEGDEVLSLSYFFVFDLDYRILCSV